MSHVITYQSPRGDKTSLTDQMERTFRDLGTWPKDDSGQEYCQVYKGKHLGYADPWVLIEEMPEQHRESHRQARNWGNYPHNGAVRRMVLRDEADEILADDPDGYAHIVTDFGLDAGSQRRRAPNSARTKKLV